MPKYGLSLSLIVNFVTSTPSTYKKTNNNIKKQTNIAGKKINEVQGIYKKNGNTEIQ